MVTGRQHLLKAGVAVGVDLNITGMEENMTTCQKGGCIVIPTGECLNTQLCTLILQYVEKVIMACT